MSDEGLVKQHGDKWQLTDSGFAYVTEMLEELGFFPKDIDLTGFEANSTWAGIVGTQMVEAGTKYLRMMAENQKQEEWDEDEESEVALVGLYIAIAHAQVDKSLAARGSERGSVSKPKFSVGQVVRVVSKTLRQWVPDYWSVARISRERDDADKFVYQVRDHEKCGPWIGEKSLRPLTRRERGGA